MGLRAEHLTIVLINGRQMRFIEELKQTPVSDIHTRNRKTAPPILTIHASHYEQNNAFYLLLDLNRFNYSYTPIISDLSSH